MRIALFGGSFDPPHNGHLAIAQAARRALGLDAVLFAPVALQPLKPSGSSASFADRVAMTRLAIANEPHFELSLIDAPGNAPNYTIETLTRLHQIYPAGAEFYLLLGADSLHTFHRWRRAAEIPFLANLIVASRPSQDLARLTAFMPPGIALRSIHPNHFQLSNAHGQQATLTILPDLHYDISATELRRQLNANPSLSPPPIPAPVLTYIRQHSLYEQSLQPIQPT